MLVPVVQFCHPARPMIDYTKKPQIWSLDVTLSPLENRYLRAVKAAYATYKDAPGLIVLEQDVAIDPRHLDEINERVAQYPHAVVAVPYLVWAASSGVNSPFWAHAVKNDKGGRVFQYAHESPCLRADWFGLGCTYLPGILLDRAPDTEQNWDYPFLDHRLSELAQRLGIPASVTVTPAVHLHW